MNTLNNRVQLIGHLGKKPELHTFENGKSKVSFSMATNDYHRNDDGEKVENTEWHNVIAWGKTAEIANEYLKEGSKVAIDGRLTHRTFEDKAGNNRYFTEVVARELLMLDKKGS
jgi:single-strand DNA-binding protein